MTHGRAAVGSILMCAAACAGVAVLAATTGCDNRSAGAGGGPASPRVARVAAAAKAGGACQRLNFADIAETIGARFSVAAAGRQGDTYTCVVQAVGASYPDLMIAVTATAADRAVFDATVRPPDATPVDDLGIVAYSSSVPTAGNAGPGTEIGWLTGNGRLIVMIYHLSPGSSTEDALAMTPNLVALAKKVDFADS